MSKERMKMSKELSEALKMLPKKMSEEKEEYANGCKSDLPAELKVLSPIHELKDEFFMTKLIAFLQNSNFGGVFDIAKNFMKFLHSPQETGDDAAYTLSSMIEKVWREPCFVNCVRLTIKEYYPTIPWLCCHLNNDSAAERADHMEADWCFKPSLLSTISDTSIATLLRVFLSILFGHWTGEGELMELDKTMGEHHFQKQLDFIAKAKAKAVVRLTERELEFDEISYIMKSASDVENMEPLRKELVNKYGDGGIDIQAILDKVKTNLVQCVDINLKYLGYDGGQATIEICIAGGSLCNGIFIRSNQDPYKAS